MSFQFCSSANIPVFVVFQRDENNDDDASMVSFSTSSYSQRSDISCYTAGQDSESRWDPLELQATTTAAARSASGRALATLQQKSLSQRRRRSSIEESPHHPERSISFSSSTATNNNNNNCNNNNSPPSSTKFHGQHTAPTAVAARTGGPATTHHHRVSPPKQRATRLSRMAERAKAVRARTPVGARKKSFHQHQMHHIRRSLPEAHHSHSSHQAVRLPVRTKSSTLRRSSLGCSPAPRNNSLGLDCSGSSSLSPLSGNNGSPPSSFSNKRSRSMMIPVRRRNSIQCILPSPPTTQGRAGGVLCPTRSTGRGLEAMILRQRALSHRQLTTHQQQCRASVGAMSLPATAGAAAVANQPPRLPQRFPSEATPKQIEQQG